jgi:hypothetical protein
MLLGERGGDRDQRESDQLRAASETRGQRAIEKKTRMLPEGHRVL